MQLKILALLDNHRAKRHSDDAATYLTVIELAEAMAPEPTVALIESVRRAVKKLAAEKVVEIATVSVDRDVAGRTHRVPKHMLAARMGVQL